MKGREKGKGRKTTIFYFTIDKVRQGTLASFREFKVFYSNKTRYFPFFSFQKIFSATDRLPTPAPPALDCRSSCASWPSVLRPSSWPRRGGTWPGGLSRPGQGGVRASPAARGGKRGSCTWTAPRTGRCQARCPLWGCQGPKRG